MSLAQMPVGFVPERSNQSSDDNTAVLAKEVCRLKGIADVSEGRLRVATLETQLETADEQVAELAAEVRRLQARVSELEDQNLVLQSITEDFMSAMKHIQKTAKQAMKA